MFPMITQFRRKVYQKLWKNEILILSVFSLQRRMSDQWKTLKKSTVDKIHSFNIMEIEAKEKMGTIFNYY